MQEDNIKVRVSRSLSSMFFNPKRPWAFRDQVKKYAINTYTIKTDTSVEQARHLTHNNQKY